MKKIYILIVYLLMLTSCEKEYAYTYIVKNETDYTIYLKAFDINVNSHYPLVSDSTKTYSESYIIFPQTELIKIKSAGYHPDDQGIFEASGVDSISIVFDSLRIITFACEKLSGENCLGEYNLMDYENNFEKVKTGQSSGEDEYTYTFVFTNDDFEKAQALGVKK
jgi:hypothetical protein